jgi:aspartyl-tRNA(Asn)/glutamyl-tRNA(Gln) amidotransferase subunit A
LHGLPVVVKDLFDVAGEVTSGCCRAVVRAPSPASAATVDALVRAGAIVVAKTNQHELGSGATNAVSAAGAARNPWDDQRMTGGSSGGSAAAVGAGVVAAALGTDAGGSVRIPASFCGVTALKPTHGAISLRGAMPTAASFDTAGPIARTARDCQLLYDVMVGYDPGDPVSIPRPGGPAPPVPPLSGLRVGLVSSFLRLLDPETRVAVERAASVLVELGLRVDVVDGPPDPEDGVAALLEIAPPEIAHAYRDLWDDPRVSPEISALFGYGRGRSAMDYLDGLRLARQVRHHFRRALDGYDLLLLPATPYPAPGLDQATVRVDGGELDTVTGPARLTNPVSVARLPSLAMPVAMTAAGLPIGAQLVGPLWSESLLCGVGAAYQAATDWHLRSP